MGLSLLFELSFFNNSFQAKTSLCLARSIWKMRTVEIYKKSQSKKSWNCISKWLRAKTSSSDENLERCANAAWFLTKTSLTISISKILSPERESLSKSVRRIYFFFCSFGKKIGSIEEIFIKNTRAHQKSI